MSTTIRRTLAVAGLVLASLAGSTGLGSTPAGAGAPSFCDESQARQFICRTYLGFFRRNLTQAELDYWAPQMPHRKTFMIATVGRAPESRRRTIERYYDHFADRMPGQGETAYWEGEVLEANGLRRLEAALLGEFPGTPSEFVQWAFLTVLGRSSGGPEQVFWEGYAEAKGYNVTAAALAFTPEARRSRAFWAIYNQFEYEPDDASRDYWAERLRTGLSYLDLRISLWTASYPQIQGTCMTLAPPTGPGCA